MTPLADRFWPKVDREADGGHWIWTGAHDHHGYGRIQRGGRAGGILKAHRVAYELVVGPIPEGLEIDHLCRVSSCVNPAHLESVTHLTNMRRGIAARATCRQGHPWTPENTAIVPGRGTRLCRTCSRARWNRSHQTKRLRRQGMDFDELAALLAGEPDEVSA